MKITKVNIPESFDYNGIEDIKMDRLGKIVLIAGKNGSGKTRLLAKIRSGLSQKKGLFLINPGKEFSKNQKDEIEILKRQLDDIEVRFVREPYSEGLLRAKERIVQNSSIWNLVETSELDEQYTLINFVPKILQLSDSNNYPKNSLLELSRSVNNIGVDNLPSGTFAKIQTVQNRWFSATHPSNETKEEEKALSIKNYEKLQNLVKIFLNTSIGRDNDDNATLFGFPLGQTNLSDGQKILLQFCVAIYSQNASLNNIILVMDEPENHLHPSIIVETIDRISEYVTNGQIWIATHSIPLLAHFDSNSIWYMDEGKISYAGNIPEKVLETLLGDEHEIAKLQDFIGLPAQLALNRFAYECLFEPESVDTGKNDPQISQIKNKLQEFGKDGKVKILDYGAGKGRILANIIENSGDKLNEFAEKFDYIAYDEFNADKDMCEELINKIYGSSKNKYFNDYRSLANNHNDSSFDIVIMSNVLHEIEPKEWLKLFSKDGTITSQLTENGVLLLVEDTQIPVGEKAYQNGFIVLDTPQLRCLFNMKNEEFNSIDDARNDGRLKCHLIPKDCLARITPESIKSALKSLEKIAKEEIIKLRKPKTDRNYKNGRLHGYWVQQLANTRLALLEYSTD